MRRLIVVALFFLCAWSAFGQVDVDLFNNLRPDTLYANRFGGSTRVGLTADTLDKVEGKASLLEHAVLPATNTWGTFAMLGQSAPTDSRWDWSASDSLSLWLKVVKAPVLPVNVVFRMHIVDQDAPANNGEEWIYENATILDAVNSSWVNLRIPLLDRVSTGTEAPDSTGFIIAPTNWGMASNNKTFDRDKIVGFRLVVVTTTIDADSIDVKFDRFERFGHRSYPVVIFGGKDWPSYYSKFDWGNSVTSIEANAGTIPGEAAIKWVQGDQWSNGWTGWGGNFSSPFDMAGAWMKDSVKMWIKADSCGPLRAQFESGGGKKGIVFQPAQDGQWHKYALALRSMVPQDGTTGFDSSAITVFGLMAEASAVAGRIVYITEIWTGTPTLDVIPPASPHNLLAIGGGFSNLLTWDAVPNEPGVRYNVYYADHTWTSPDSTVDDIPPYNLTSSIATHVLLAPKTDQNVSYFYGVTAKDLAGNVSTPTVMTSLSTTTMAKGVPTISLTPPSSFVADGNASEWSSVSPFWLSAFSGGPTAHGVPNYLVTSDADLSVNAYLAVDANALYVAFDVTDNIVNVDTAGTDYQQDCPDLFIGLYDWRGPHHTGYTGGARPDYHLRFSKNRIRIDNDGGATVMAAGTSNYAWKEKVLTPGYIVEAKIPWTLLAAALPLRHDVVFSPKEGMRIPVDFAVNDNDGGTTRHAIMCYSSISNDNSWSDQFMWTNTWIGNKWTVGVKQISDVAQTYSLDQNYPNPFNPSTQIRYNLEKAGMVSLKVFDVLGREVVTLVNDRQETGSYSVTFDAAQSGRTLSSGVYFYRLEAGSYVSTHKMMLLK